MRSEATLQLNIILYFTYSVVTFNAGRWATTPREVPLAGDDVRAADVVSWQACVSQHTASHRRRMG